MSEALLLIEKAEKAHADFIEVRMDSLENSRRLSDLSASTKIPLIATNKPISEKGFFSGSETDRSQTLINAAKAGFGYVDLNLSSLKLEELIKEIKLLGAKPTISYHNYDGPVSVKEMNSILEKEIASGASICKIVTTAKKIYDNLEILNFVSANSSKTKLVCFCMGDLGKISRLLSPTFGAFFTFASIEQNSQTAPGQMSIQEIKDEIKFLGLK